MIFLAFIKLAYSMVYVLTYLLRFADDVTLPTVLTSGIVDVSNAVMLINNIFPVTETIYLLIGIFVVYEVAYFGLKIINWIIRKIPTIS